MTQPCQICEQTAKNKPIWPAGPWHDEPDVVVFVHAGLPCLLHRHPRQGHWCGYVGIPPDHAYHTNATMVPLIVHGGITFQCSPEKLPHQPVPTGAENCWWLGWDAMHAGDLLPGLVAMLNDAGFNSFPDDIYRDLAFARQQTKSLAEQLAAMDMPVPDGSTG